MFIGLDGLSIDEYDVAWLVCNSDVCYTETGINAFFGQIVTTDTIKVCYDAYLYTANTSDTCYHCDSLVFDQGAWVLFSTSQSVGIKEFTISKINDNKMYDLNGRHILKPKGLYIKNNKLYYGRTNN